MIGYVLLVVIAIGLSVAVFSYLRLYLPKEGPKCYDDVTLSIEQVQCASGIVNVTIENRGRFTVNGAFIRMGDAGRVFKLVLNNDDGNLFLTPDGGILPGKTWNDAYNEADYPGGNFSGIQEIEIEPFIYIDNEPALCQQSIVSQQINCS